MRAAYQVASVVSKILRLNHKFLVSFVFKETYPIGLIVHSTLGLISNHVIIDNGGSLFSSFLLKTFSSN